MVDKLSTIAITAVAGINAIEIEEEQLALAQVDAEATFWNRIVEWLPPPMSFAEQIQNVKWEWADIRSSGRYKGPDHALPTNMRYLDGSETWDWAR